MNDFLTSNSINIWPAVGLALGFPLIVLFLNELISSLERRGNPLARTLRTFRNFVVPALAVVVFIVYIVEAPAGGTLVRVAETAFQGLKGNLGVEWGNRLDGNFSRC